MRCIYHLSLLAFVCAALSASPAMAVLSLADGSYDLTFSATENNNDFAGSSTVSGGLDVEIFDGLSDGARFLDFSSTVFSDLSMRLSIEPLGASGFGYPLVGTFELTGLDFVDNGNPADIIDVTFDAARTNIGQYANAGEFITPTASFSPTSVMIQFGFDGSGLAGDQPYVYFNLSTQVVPEPAAWTILLAGGLLAIGVARRRRARHLAK